jgi:hypothetical protein
MNISEYLETIYFGDRGCKSILIDGCSHEVKIQVDCISRVRAETWNYYTKEDLYDGCIVFEGVSSISIKPNGVIPNGYINDISAELAKKNEYLIKLYIDADTSDGIRIEAEIEIIANAMSLEDKLKPGVRIRE